MIDMVFYHTGPKIPINYLLEMVVNHRATHFTITAGWISWVGAIVETKLATISGCGRRDIISHL